MSAIKYVGRHLWEVVVSHDFLNTRSTTPLLVTTSATTGRHITRAVRATDDFLFRNEKLPNARIESIEYRGTIDI
jgi:hypothetical protein